jgi:hypothetical protein
VPRKDIEDLCGVIDPTFDNPLKSSEMNPCPTAGTSMVTNTMSGTASEADASPRCRDSVMLEVTDTQTVQNVDYKLLVHSFV